MTSTILSQSDLATLVADLVAAGTRVIAPVPAGEDSRRAEYRPIERLEEAALRGALPRRSLKELFLPPSEVLLRYRQKKDGVDLREVPTTFPPQVVLGARPCDAAGVETLDNVMGWDHRDELWFGRREATTIVGVACPGLDSLCFCTAVGLGPDSTKGLDALLVPLERPSGPRPSQRGALLLSEAVEAFLHDAEPFAGAADLDGASESRARPPEAASRYLARALTAKGEALLEGRGTSFVGAEDLEKAAGFVQAARQKVAKNLAASAPSGNGIEGDPEARLGIAAADGGDLVAGTGARSAEPRSALGVLPEWLARHFDHPVWKSIALRCHGCGACTAICPTCHCFDILDEHDAYGRGARRRNWDFCQSAKFTLHASGHNPRPSQTERFRQRVMHKFSIYPRRFESFLCTGCGRCARACGAGMSLPEILGDLVHLAGAEAQGSNP